MMAWRSVLARAAFCIVLSMTLAPARAIVLTVLESAPNVVTVTATGSIDLSRFTGGGFVNNNPVGIWPENAVISTGGPGSVYARLFTGLSGPASFGSGGFTTASSFSGQYFALLAGADFAEPFFVVATDYVSGSQFSSSATFNGSTFANLGLVPGTYDYSGNGETVTVQIVSEPATLAMLAGGLGLIGAALRRAGAQRGFRRSIGVSSAPARQ